MRCGIRCLVREACSLDWPGPVGLDYAGQTPAGLDKSYQACGIRLDSGLGLADERLEWEKKCPTAVDYLFSYYIFFRTRQYKQAKRHYSINLEGLIVLNYFRPFPPTSFLCLTAASQDIFSVCRIVIKLHATSYDCSLCFHSHWNFTATRGLMDKNSVASKRFPPNGDQSKDKFSEDERARQSKS